VEQAYINLENAESQYAASQVQLKAAAESYRIASEQLKLEALDAVSFLVQKNLYIQAQQQNIQARYTVILNRSIYEFYLGKPLSFE
jgi:outer membrane protein